MAGNDFLATDELPTLQRNPVLVHLVPAGHLDFKSLYRTRFVLLTRLRTTQARVSPGFKLDFAHLYQLGVDHQFLREIKSCGPVRTDNRVRTLLSFKHEFVDAFADNGPVLTNIHRMDFFIDLEAD